MSDSMTSMTNLRWARPQSAMGLACEGLHKRYGRVHALAGLDLRIEAGVALGLVGRNGAGKSTLFRAILGIERADAGRVLPLTAEGLIANLRREEFLSRIGFVPDRLSVYDWMTVGSAIEHVASLQPRFDHPWCEELLEAIRLDRGRRVRELSRGMQARLAFLLGVSHRPGILLLDEPLLGVDAVSHDVLLSLLARLRSETGCAVLIASHALGDLARIADRVAFVDRGRVVEEVSVDALIAETKRVVLRPAPANFTAPPETVNAVRQDEALILTVRDFTLELAERLRALVPDGRIDIVDLTISEACADRMRAQEALS